MPDVFISYSSKDRAFAQRLATALKDAGLDVWFDREDIRAGEEWDQAVYDGLRESKVLLLVVSPNAAESKNVKDEWSYFHSKEKPIIPVRLQDAEIHFQLTRLQFVDFMNQDFKSGVTHLMRELASKGVGTTNVASVTQTVNVTVQPDRSYLPILGIVAVVAIVGIVLLLTFFRDSQNAGGNPTPVLESVTLQAVGDNVTDAVTEESADSEETAGVNATTEATEPAENTTELTECPGSPPIRLAVGDIAQVTSGFGFVNLRRLPESSDVLTQIPRGETFEIVGGPACGVGIQRTWWNVQYNDQSGWVAEGTGEDTYWIEPSE